MLKMNAALTPLVERGINIFGDESNLTGPADCWWNPKSGD